MDFTTFSFAISSFSDVSETIPALVWLIFLKKGQPYCVIGFFFVISAVIKLFTLVTAEIGINNMPAFHILACLEVAFLYVFYNKISFNHVYSFGLIMIVAFNIANTLFAQGIFTFNSNAWAINSMILIVLGLIYLFKLYNTEIAIELERKPEFVIASGWLIYAAGSLFTYLMGTEILSGKPEGFFHNAWFFQCVSNLVKNGIVSYGLWLTRSN